MTRALDRMGKLVGSRLRTVLDAYAGSDLPMATRVWRTDDEVDEHYNALFVQLVGGMTRDGRTIPTCAHMLSMAKNLERIGDHATNIAEHVHYELTGAAPEGERPHFSAARDAQGASR
jgi:phosphate transport system protein